MSNVPNGRPRAFDQIQFEATLDDVIAQPSCMIHPEISITVTSAPDIPTEFAQEAFPILALAFNDRQWNAAIAREAVLTSSSCQLLIAARTTEKLTGFVTVHSTIRPNRGKLHWLTVTPQWRRKRVGTVLTLAACSIASTELKYETITLKTEKYRSAAISLYRKLGFREIPTP